MSDQLMHSVVVVAAVAAVAGTQEQTDSLREAYVDELLTCLLYTSPSPRDATLSRMPSSA